MSGMVDPADAMTSFQGALIHREISVQQCALDNALWVYADEPLPGENRWSYVRLENEVVTAFVVYCIGEPVNGIPCLHIGYAVPPALQGKGRAQDIIKASIAELKHGLARRGVERFFVEAMVGEYNSASNAVAKAVLSSSPRACVDMASGEPALQYLKLVQHNAALAF